MDADSVGYRFDRDSRLKWCKGVPIEEKRLRVREHMAEVIINEMQQITD
jgi:hypothetical protein